MRPLVLLAAVVVVTLAAQTNVVGPKAAVFWDRFTRQLAFEKHQKGYFFNPAYQFSTTVKGRARIRLPSDNMLSAPLPENERTIPLPLVSAVVI